MMKRFTFLICFVFASIIGRAQFYKSVLPSPEFNTALEKIVLDFRFNFETIKGNNLSDEGDMRTFESTVKLPGANDCIIHYFNSRVDTTASWQAVMYSGNDYKEALRTYQNVFRLIKKSRIHWIDRTLVGFDGTMETPKEEVRFAMSTLNFELDDARYQRFIAEVELLNSYAGWSVHLNLHTKTPDDQILPGLN